MKPVTEAASHQLKLDAEAAIERCYSAFSHYPPPKELEASPLRDAKALLADLHSAPLRSLPADRLDTYASFALTTVGSPADYKHYLPRILELAARYDFAHGCQPFVIMSKLNLAEWPKWPEPERKAVSDVIAAAFAAIPTVWPDLVQGFDWLDLGESVGLQKVEMLRSWTSRPSYGAAQCVAEFANECLGKFPRLQRDGQSDALKDIMRWVTDKETEKLLFDYLDEDDKSGSSIIEIALYAIESLRRSTKN